VRLGPSRGDGTDGTLRDKNDFSESAWFENLFMCAGSLSQRQLRPDTAQE